MRSLARFAACIGVALAVAGCDPLTERRYVNEGAGIDLYTSDGARQVELLNQYISFICLQAGQGPICDNTTLFHAGMNDIDLRCDGFLTWLDARRRDREPILAELSAINAAVHSIMTVTGSSPKSLDIVTAAFGLASATYANWNSRLLLSINQSTVQDVVYTSQGEFHKKFKNYIVPDRPTAIYLLRNYLRLCMPTTIEAKINITSTLVENDQPLAAKNHLVVSTTTPAVVRVTSTFRSDDAAVALRRFWKPNGVVDPGNEKTITDFMAQKGITESIAFFIRSAQYAAQRDELARQRGLIR